MDFLIVLERTILFYIIITLLYRFMGKREVGQLGIVDLIVSILIAELAAMSIDNRDENIFLSIIPTFDIIRNMRNLILASQSPRRKELLEKCGYPFSIIVARVFYSKK